MFLGGKEGENAAYSPVNVYMALAMLAELTDGASRQQILDLLGSDSLEACGSRPRRCGGLSIKTTGPPPPF